MAYGKFQNQRITDPYAEIISLFPLFYVLLVVNAILTLYFIWHLEMKSRLQVTCLFFSCLILWFTPYLMSGFVKQADTPWHMGMANYAPNILNGEHMPFDSYVTDFPLSYIWGYSIISITGIDLISIANYVLPFIFTLILLLLIYLIFSSFYTKKIASVALIISIPLLHHISLHFSPQVFGTIFLLTSVLLLLKNKVYASLFIGFLLLPITHLLSFFTYIIFFCIFFIFKYPTKINTRKFIKLWENNKKLLLLAISICIALGIIFIISFTSIPSYFNLLLTKLPGLDVKQFIFENIISTPWFKQIAFVMYFVLFLIFGFIILKLYKRKKSKTKKISIVFKESSWTTKTIVLFSIACLFYGIALALIQKASVLIERGLTFFLLFSILFIVAKSILVNDDNFTKPYSRKQYKILVFVVVSLFLLYPICSYSIDAYNSYPVSDERGLIFLTSTVNLTGKSLEMPAAGQIDAFIAPGDNISFISTRGYYDVVVYGLSMEIKERMHNPDDPNLVELKFNALNANSNYNIIYYNPTFHIYMNNNLSEG